MNTKTSEATRWFAVIAAFGAGIIGAAHIGKVPAALPAMRVEFAMDMVRAGWVVSIFSATGMIFGMAVGLVSDRLGHIRPALLGMALMALGALAGAYTDSAF
ncbi:MAG: MFS transporter, partial [Alphaproteobacteria bacterium]